MEQVHILSEEHLMDFWSESNGVFDVRVSAEELKVVESLGIKYDIFIQDVQALIDAETIANSNPTGPTDEIWFRSYHNYSEIVEYVQSLADKYDEITTFVDSINNARSIENRKIPALIIQSELGAAPKPTIFISTMQHSREWIGPATVLYIVTELLDSYGKVDQITALVNAFDFIIIPVVNPDGYEFSINSNRLWRKNRRVNGGGTFGVDLNRNWNEKWGKAGSSTNPGSDTYQGTAPFSEPETKAVSDYFTQNGGIAGGIDFHSYGQLILRPYGDTFDAPPNDAELKALGDGVRDSIFANSGVRYTSQKAIDLYPASGTASGWYYQEQADTQKSAHPFSFTIELRDTGNYGFVLPPGQIIATGEENFQGFLYYLEYIRDINQKK